jgi:hypothetical protein
MGQKKLEMDQIYIFWRWKIILAACFCADYEKDKIVAKTIPYSKNRVQGR